VYQTYSRPAHTEQSNEGQGVQSRIRILHSSSIMADAFIHAALFIYCTNVHLIQLQVARKPGLPATVRVMIHAVGRREKKLHEVH